MSTFSSHIVEAKKMRLQHKVLRKNYAEKIKSCWGFVSCSRGVLEDESFQQKMKGFG